MTTLDRRQFFQVTTASYLLGSLGTTGASASGEISEKDRLLSVEQPGYRWEWSEESDRFRILDHKGNTITTGPLQPAVVVQSLGQNRSRRSTAGKLENREVQGNRVVWTYSNVNGSGKLSVAWRFDARGLWLAKYNGLTHLIRPGNLFTIQPLDAVYEAVTRGAHASSWARKEGGKIVLVALRPRRPDGSTGMSQCEDLVSTTAQVAVASLTEDNLAEANRLGVVPYGVGRLTIQRQSKSPATASLHEHCFGGHSQTRRVEVRNGVLSIPPRERDGEGSPVEWIEVEI